MSLLGGVSISSAQLPRPQHHPAAALFDGGLRALSDGLPQVAAYRLRAYLETRPGPAERRGAVLALVRALIALPDAPAALALLNSEYPTEGAQSGTSRGDAGILFWRGQIAGALGRWDDALASYTEAVAATDKSPANAATDEKNLHDEAVFGQGEASLALGRKPEAAAAYRSLRDHPQLGAAARLRYAEIALDTAHLKDATYVLTDTARHGNSHPAIGDPLSLAKERTYLLGRLHLAEQQPAVAAKEFLAALAQSEGLSERLLIDCYWGWTQACLDQGNLETAQDALENLIERYPLNPSIGPTFSWLESLYARDTAPDLTVLRRWAADPAEPDREARARLALARLEERAGHPDKAEELFAGFQDAFPSNGLCVRAQLDLAALRLRLGRPAEARHSLDLARALVAKEQKQTAAGATADTTRQWATEMGVLDARICLAQSDSAGAAQRFEAVAARIGAGPEAEAAAFNAVVGWLRAMDVSRFTAAEKEFAARFPKSALNAEFPLEEGLARADQIPPIDYVGRRHAADCLRQFLGENPTHPRAAEAHIALAEIAFERPRQDVNAAWHELEAPELQPISNDVASPGQSPAAASTPATLAERDRAAYLAIWLADAPGPSHDEDRAIALAKKFLADRSDSALAAETRMKLGEIYFKREDYPDAQTQLESLVENAPNSTLTEPALYLAGMAASLSMSQEGLDKAVVLFESVAHRGGPFKLAARLQQADVQNRLGKGRDALILYDGVLAATANASTLNDADFESRCAALCGRGKTLLSLAEADPGDKKLFTDAVQAFDQLAQGTPGASLLWRRQALTLKGSALEKLGEMDAALAAYDDALEAPEPPPALNEGGGASGSAATVPPEWVWFYRAGYDAAKLLEARSNWVSAIAVYKKLASADGPMKKEVEQLLSRRRLEHFIWEE